MPYVAVADDTLVMPDQVSNGQRVTCPACGGEMSVRQAHYNQGNLIPRHFAHLAGADCGGESSTLGGISPIPEGMAGHLRATHPRHCLDLRAPSKMTPGSVWTTAGGLS